MNRNVWMIVLFVFGTAASAAWADSPTSTAVSPPSRPLALTAEQISAMEQVAHQPQYAVDWDVRASYSPKAARVVDDISARTIQLGLPAGIIALLIAAAPL